jgi:hypothetical protein
MALLLAAADITATTAYSEPLPMAQADSPYDVLVVANLNAFPKNIDGSLRLADPTSGVVISTCYLNDHSDKAFVWPTALNDRKRRKALEPLLDVPTAYAAQGVPQLSEEVQTSLRRSLKPLVKARSSSARDGMVRFDCDLYRYERTHGAAEIAINARAFAIPAYLVPALVTELQSYRAYAEPEKFAPDQYTVIGRVTLVDLQTRAKDKEATLIARRELLDAYRTAALAPDDARVGLVHLDRPALQPVVCLIKGKGAAHDAAITYVEQWRPAYRRELQSSLADRGDARTDVLGDVPDTGKLVELPDVNDAFVGMTSSRRCDAFAGPPAEVLQVHDALRRDHAKMPLRLAGLRDVPTLSEQFAASAGFSRYRDLEFSRTLGATRGQALSLIEQGIADAPTYESLRAEIRSSGYSPSSDLTLALAYLEDRRIGASRGLSAVAERDRRVEEDAQRTAALQARRRAEQAAFDAEYPYEIVLRCGLIGRHTAITPCFAGDTDGGNTQLELRTPDRYALYQFFELRAAGTEVPGEGLKISVKRPFSLRAQNADARLTLTVTVREKRSGSVLFTKSAGQFGVISTDF